MSMETPTIPTATEQKPAFREYLMQDSSTGRIRERAVNAKTLAKEAATKAFDENRPVVDFDYGGGVPAAYDYPAQTEAAVVVAFPDRANNRVDVAIWKTQVDARGGANYARGVVGCLGEWARPIADSRFGDERTEAAREAIIKHAGAKILERQRAEKTRDEAEIER